MRRFGIESFSEATGAFTIKEGPGGPLVFADEALAVERERDGLRTRLAEIEAAKGGLSEEERERFDHMNGSTLFTLHEQQDACIALRLDDAIRAANAELARVRGMMSELLRVLSESPGTRQAHFAEVVEAARAYLRETEG